MEPESTRKSRRADEVDGRLATQYEVVRILAESPDVTAAIQRTLEAVGKNLGWQVGAYWEILSAEEPILRCGHVWNDGLSPNHEEFAAALTGYKFNPGVGLPGRVWVDGQPLWVMDFSSDPKYPRGKVAAAYGLSSAFAFPVHGSTQVLGVLEFFSEKERHADAGLLESMTSSGSQIGQFIERKRAEAALVLSEQRYRAIVETASECILTLDSSSVILACNPAVERVFGYTPSELIGQSMTVLMPKRFRAQHRAGIQRYVNTGERGLDWHRIELPGLHRDGHEVPLAISFGEYRHAGKHYFTGFIRDIAEQKLRERESRLQQQEIERLLANIPDVVSRYTPDLRYSYISPAVERATGIPPAAFIGKSHAEVGFPTEIAMRFDASLRQVFKTGKPGALEFDYGYAGESRQYSGIAVPEFGEDGNVISVLTITRDVTDQKRAEENLRQSQERFRLAVDAGSIGLWDWDIAADSVAWSDKVYEFHGLQRDQFDGSVASFSRLIHSEDSERVNAALTATLEHDIPYALEFRAIRPDGSTRYLATQAKLLRDAAGKPVRLLGAVVDVTERKLAEEALRKSEKLAATGRLAASIAHEINNPLEAVTNLLYLMNTEPLSAQAKQWLSDAQAEVGRAGQLTRKALGFYRESQAAGQVTLGPLVEEVLSVYATRVLQKKLVVKTDLSPQGVVFGLSGELRQILSNLISNALDALGSHGELRINVGRDKGFVVLEVIDSGGGIAADHLPKIFEPFFTTKKDFGTGLGLWVTRELVEKQGGTISVRSQVNGTEPGTTFTVRFPAIEPAKTPVAP